ncbi:hypothetical protein DPMN_085427 [Dreissena polymorpha]|nr:hypothetical protein DPMN_085427 [Dreissena polymorpha]
MLMCKGQLGRIFGGKVAEDPDLTARLDAPNEEYCFVFRLDVLKTDIAQIFIHDMSFRKRF